MGGGFQSRSDVYLVVGCLFGAKHRNSLIRADDGLKKPGFVVSSAKAINCGGLCVKKCCEGSISPYDEAVYA